MMTTEQIADRLIQLCKKGQNALAQVELYADDIVSIESQKTRFRKTTGIDKVQKKTAMFFKLVQKIHTYTISDPLVVDNHICFKMSIDAHVRGFGRIQFSELCMYSTKNGKIIKEEFYYAPSLTEETA